MKPIHPLLLTAFVGLAVSFGFAQEAVRAPFAKTAVPAHAQARAAAVQVRVAPDHRDWNYRIGESSKFVLNVIAYNVITSPKSLLLALETGHNAIPEESAFINTWIVQQLGIK